VTRVFRAMAAGGSAAPAMAAALAAAALSAAPGMVTSAPAAGADGDARAVRVTAPSIAPSTVPSSPRAWLDGVERLLAGVSGRAARLVPPAGMEDGFESPVFVFFAPLSTVWILDAETVGDAAASEVTDTAALLREETGEGGRLHVLWRRGPTATLEWPLPLPELRAAPETHPLAALHGRLLSAPLASPLGGLPAGSRFTAVAAGGPGGIVGRPAGAADGRERATLWESFGDHIAVTHPDGSVTLHGRRAMDAALRGGGG